MEQYTLSFDNNITNKAINKETDVPLVIPLNL
jgi:hypothetical protein